MMNEEKYLNYIKKGIICLNFIYVIFIHYIMLYSSKIIEEKGIAREFLSGLSIKPLNMNESLIIVLTIFTILVLLIEIKTIIEPGGSILAGFIVFELLSCIIISWYTCIECGGIILLVVADISKDIKERYGQAIFLLIMGIVYVTNNYNVLAISKKMVAFSDYLVIFSRVDKAAVLAVKDVLTSVNVILFVVYMVILMRKQNKEKKEILLLNTKLNIINDELKDANEKLKDYAALQKQAGESEERNRIAREIHDTLGHTMTGLATGLDACKVLIDSNVEETKEMMQMLGEVAREGLNDIRRSVNKLRPDILENLSLADAIKRLIKQNIDMYNIAIFYACDLQNMEFEEDEENVIYRIIQESMTNSIRHGKATFINLEIKKEDIWLVITIHDNGCGCDDIIDGFGLTHMKERIEMLQGNVFFDGKDGFNVTAKIPVRWGEEND